MEFPTKISSLLVLVLTIISSSPHTIACGTCPPATPKPKTRPRLPSPKGGPVLPPIIGKPPVTLPPVITPILPPVITPILPPVVGKPPVTLPPVGGKPPVTLPPVITPILPPVVTPILPPVITPILPPVTGTPPTAKPPMTGIPPKTKPGCSPPPTPEAKCPINAIKLGACLDVLGAPVHIGDPAVECCPIIEGLVAMEAAICFCSAIKLKLLGVDIYLPLAMELLITCGKTPPPGYKCP